MQHGIAGASPRRISQRVMRPQNATEFENGKHRHRKHGDSN